MEDNLTSADPLSYTTNGSGVDLEILVSVHMVRTPRAFGLGLTSARDLGGTSTGRPK